VRLKKAPLDTVFTIVFFIMKKKHKSFKWPGFPVVFALLEALEGGNRNGTCIFYPDLVDPDLVDPDLVDPDLVDPDLVDPDLVDPDLVDPDLVDSAVARTYPVACSGVRQRNFDFRSHLNIRNHLAPPEIYCIIHIIYY